MSQANMRPPFRKKFGPSARPQFELYDDYAGQAAGGGGGPGIVITADKASNFVTGVTTGVTVTKPANTVEGDFLLSVWHARDTTNPASAGISLTGWTTIFSGVVSGAESRIGAVGIFYKRATGAEPANYTSSHESLDQWSGGQIVRITGVIASGDPLSGTPVAPTYDVVGGSPWAYTGMTTGHNGAAPIGIRFPRNSGFRAGTVTLGGTSFEKILDVDTILLCGRIQAVAGATGNFAASTDEDNDRAYAIYALRPA